MPLTFHVPVMLKQIIDQINEIDFLPTSFLDCTLGCGGHAIAISNLGSITKFIAIDRDQQALDAAKGRLKGHLPQNSKFILGEYATCCEVLMKKGEGFDLILADLGTSSLQLDDPERGFSFKFLDSPLDMRMDQSQKLTADHILNKYTQRDLENLFFEHQVPMSRKIAKKIVEWRVSNELSTVRDLLKATSGHLPRNRSLPPSTLLFQALRIAVNNELYNLQKLLPITTKLLNPCGIMIVISFHSLEDRIVKHTIKSIPELEFINKKPITATPEEVRKNPRSRSAKMRIARKLSISSS